MKLKPLLFKFLLIAIVAVCSTLLQLKSLVVVSSEEAKLSSSTSHGDKSVERLSASLNGSIREHLELQRIEEQHSLQRLRKKEPPPPWFLKKQAHIPIHFPEPRVPVALCTLQHEGQSYLDEWVNYYLALGVSKILLYDNSPDFDLKQWHNRHEHEERVDVFHHPGKNDAQQYRAYYKCLEHLKQNLTWIEFAAFFDLDEFLVLKKHDNIEEFVSQHCPSDGCDTLLVNWELYGWNGEAAYAPLPLLKRFQYKTRTTDAHVKSIARVSKTNFFRTVHCARGKNSTRYFSTKGSQGAKCPFNWRRLNDVAVLHHIYTRSLKEWSIRCKRGRADSNPRDNPGCKPMPKYTDTVFDDSAWQFLKTHVPAYGFYDENDWLFGWNKTTTMT